MSSLMALAFKHPDCDQCAGIRARAAADAALQAGVWGHLLRSVRHRPDPQRPRSNTSTDVAACPVGKSPGAVRRGPAVAAASSSDVYLLRFRRVPGLVWHHVATRDTWG